MSILLILLMMGAFAACTAPREAALPPDLPRRDVLNLVEGVLGLPWLEEVVVERTSVEEIARVDAASPVRGTATPFGRHGRWLFTARESEAADDETLAVSAVQETVTYDVEASSVRLAFLTRDEPQVDENRSLRNLLTPRQRRFHDLARIESYAAALIDQHVQLTGALAGPRSRPQSLSEDEAEALLTLVRGAAYVAALEASLAPIQSFDASQESLVRLHETIAEQLLADPTGAAAELLANDLLPDATQAALSRLLATPVDARAREAFRVFQGARFVLEARHRLTAGNFHVVLDDPPRSTAQILWPDRYFDRDVTPSRIKGRRRAGLLGLDWVAQDTGVVGAFGVYGALLGVLGPRCASGVASAWTADLLTTYALRDGDGAALAWRLEFEGRFDARSAEDSLMEACRLRFGGSAQDLADGVRRLTGGEREVLLLRSRAAVAMLVFDSSAHLDDAGVRQALSRLLEEQVHKVGARDPLSRTSSEHGVAFRLVRGLASPVLMDSTGRYDKTLDVLYGIAARQRFMLDGGAFTLIDPSAIPGIGGAIPAETSGLLYAAERTPWRTRTAAALKMFGRAHHGGLEQSRWWTPLVSGSHGQHFQSFSAVYGLLYEQGQGGGWDIFSPRPLFSHAVGLNGDDVQWGVAMDLFHERVRAGRSHHVGMLPFDLIGGVSAFDVEDSGGFSARLLAGAVEMRHRHVLPYTSHTDVSLLDGLLVRGWRDTAADSAGFSVLCGLGFGARSSANGSSAGVGRILGRHLLGGGREGLRRYFDLLYFRF